jgi:hypothetical protein
MLVFLDNFEVFLRFVVIFSKYFDSVIRHKLECPDCGVPTCRSKDAKIRTLSISYFHLIFDETQLTLVSIKCVLLYIIMSKKMKKIRLVEHIKT